MTPAQVAVLRGEIVEICAGTTFLVAGITTFVIAVMRRQRGVRVFLWLGIWSAAYGVQHLFGTDAFLAVMPHWVQVAAPYATTAVTDGGVWIAGVAWPGARSDASHRAGYDHRGIDYRRVRTAGSSQQESTTDLFG